MFGMTKLPKIYPFYNFPHPFSPSTYNVYLRHKPKKKTHNLPANLPREPTTNQSIGKMSSQGIYISCTSIADGLRVVLGER